MRIAFVHIPKTAGTSFRAALEEVLDTDRIFLAYSDSPPNNRTVDEWAAMSPEAKNAYQAILAHCHFPRMRTATLPSDFGFVTFLRDPVARNLSFYNHIARHDPRFASEPPSVADMINAGPADVRVQFDNHQTRILAGLGPKRLVTPDAVETALSNLREAFYFVGTTESFNSDIEAFFNKLGLAHAKAKRKNVSSRGLTYEQLSIRDRVALEASVAYDQVLYKAAKRLRKNE